MDHAITPGCVPAPLTNEVNGHYIFSMRRFVHVFVLSLSITMPLFAAKVEFPRACVDCHTGQKDTPAALGVRLKEWTTRVDPEKVRRSQIADRSSGGTANCEPRTV